MLDYKQIIIVRRLLSYILDDILKFSSLKDVTHSNFSKVTCSIPSPLARHLMSNVSSGSRMTSIQFFFCLEAHLVSSLASQSGPAQTFVKGGKCLSRDLLFLRARYKNNNDNFQIIILINLLFRIFYKAEIKYYKPALFFTITWTTDIPWAYWSFPKQA